MRGDPWLGPKQCKQADGFNVADGLYGSTLSWQSTDEVLLLLLSLLLLLYFTMITIIAIITTTIIAIIYYYYYYYYYYYFKATVAQPAVKA